ncbi:MAG: diadenylate cyclase CdaA [Bacteroidales bacterium]|jgi:diadenylate cyclase|nr:diadenylate cyclase CdaA [Bacteroidales bacterium]MDD2205277.1 diadenylate cyclase CdaA [Bacteroidales bacterium]MDD3151273.1 diadenylate cyclase CdaA [Bacteroidales bacterium]MDD3914244.1 diadenylate cyclase CdaA [Bacteroidales bacterium]MDD4633440.1 diadenylate cyclase CdaA [Bacteroidales bacterium]
MLLELCFIAIKVVDVIDVVLVALLLYALYKLLKGTAAINIFLGIVAIFITWKIVEALQMKMLTEIFGAFISVGFIALIIVFQPEIREFLLMIGKPLGDGNKKIPWLKKFSDKGRKYDYNILINVVYRFAKLKTGAIIVITKENLLTNIVQTGETINADLSGRLLGNLFFKNSPLHDGAVIITNNKIVAAACILPVSQNSSLPTDFGLRHRAAVGITEQTDAVAIIVSEERGTVSFASEGKVINDIPQEELIRQMNTAFPDSVQISS